MSIEIRSNTIHRRNIIGKDGQICVAYNESNKVTEICVGTQSIFIHKDYFPCFAEVVKEINAISSLTTD